MGKGSRTGHSRYRAQRERVIRRGRRDETPCCFCGGAIDYDLAYPDPWSVSADHATPVNRGGANYGVGVELRVCHLRCNIVAGDRYGARDEGVAVTQIVEYSTRSLRSGEGTSLN